MKPLSRTLATLIILSSAAIAHADLFTFNFSGTGQSASGSLTANPTGTAGQFLITSISGTLTGVNIATLLAPGTFVGNDNFLMFNGSTFIPDGAGFSFSLSNGVLVNVFTFTLPPLAGQQFITRSDGGQAQMTTFQITPTAVPEASSFLLLGPGLAGLAQAARLRRSRS